MEDWAEWRDVDDGNGKGDFGLAFDLNFQIEKYRFDSHKERLRGMFDHLLVSFMKEKSAGKGIRPIPALGGDGRPVDLFKLFWVVRKIGGHNTVSRNKLWGFVSEECGLGFRAIPSIKLIYMKYLNELDQWLQVFSESSSKEDGRSGVVEKLDILSRELETRFKGLSQDEQERKEQERDDEFVEHTKDGADSTLDISESELRLSHDGGIGGQVENTIDLLVDEDGKVDSENNHSQVSAGRIDGSITYGLHGNADKSTDDTFAVNGANGFSEGRIGEDCRKSSNEDIDTTIASAKKAMEKVINRVLSGEIISAERHHTKDNNNVCVLAEKVAKKSFSKAHHLSEDITDDEERLSAQQDSDTATPARSDVGNILESRKRKRQPQSFAGMLSWLIHIARHSDDPSIGSLPECSKWSNYGVKEFWVQVLLARETLQIRRHSNAHTGEKLLKDQKKKARMHPSMYEDDVPDYQSTKKVRYSTRIPSLTKSSLCPCCNSCAAPQSENGIHHAVEVGNSLPVPVNLVVADVEEPATCLHYHKSSAVPAEKHVSVGPLFQAEIPEWSGRVSDSNSKWLGTRMWWPEDDEGSSLMGSIGKEWAHICSCLFPDSVECVRFHIAEKRLKLKHELGLLFYHWRFNHMGEEVSLSWREEEEKRFKDMMKSHDAFSKNFWNNASRSLPSKTREDLVGYYFNVFLVQRRSYQNRVVPKDIDSDDDEKECGSIGGSFGYQGLYIPSSRFIPCTLNKESTELV